MGREQVREECFRFTTRRRKRVIAQVPDAAADDVNRAVAACKSRVRRRAMGKYYCAGAWPRAVPVGR